ncbi:PDC sensor domain-containing protein [Sulfurimonas sp.]|uniref:PDC sensor domain-containing protein n=1 Tax=Sulfurimonas sp. TaxID=2022749 RepID=UPI0025DCAE4C|nr:PDC sensor domain-containing protein [Sulfurimonas sp.]MBW6489412.1 PDC sensor domain-containing protein [Sulfurimonas sp.]
MKASDIQNFSEGRTKARAYFCYLFSKNIQNRLPSLTQDVIVHSLLKIKADLEKCEGVYLLDSRGVQVSPTFTATTQIDEDAGRIRADRAYFYRAVKEGRCTVTDPYPSLITGDLTVTTSQPIYDEHGELKFVACLDMPLNEVIKISRSTIYDKFFNNIFKYTYAIFSFALMGVALLLFLKGMQSFFIYEITPDNFQIKDVFEATILITLALAIFDLAKTLIEEELLGRNKNNSIFGPHKTMVRFLGSIIIALSIEALMLVFKFAITEPENIVYAMYIIAGVSLLLLTLAVYIKFTKLKIEE